MSEHAWVIDNLAAYVAGGLDAEECERVDVHVASCEPCAAALQDARAFDHGMDSLFAPTRPAPALEDRIIQVFRVASKPRSQPHWSRKLAWGAAATVALGATGAAVSRLSPEGGLPFPGVTRTSEVVESRTGKPDRSWGITLDDTGSMPANTSYWSPFIEQDNLYAEGEQIRGRQGWTSVREPGFFPPSQGAYSNGEKDTTLSHVTDGASNSVVFDSFQDSKKPVPNAAYSTRDQTTEFYKTDGSVHFGPRPDQGVAVSPDGRRLASAGSNNENNPGFGRGGFGGGLGGFGGGGLGGAMGMTGGSGTTAITGVPVPGATGPALTTGNFQPAPGKISDKEDGSSPARTPPPSDNTKEKENKELKDAGKPGANTVANAYSLFIPDDHRAKLEKQNTEGKELKDGEKTQVASSPQQDSNKGTGSGPGQADPKKTQPPQEQVAARKVIRSGDIEFEVPSFDSAAAAVTKLVTNIKGAFVATINSDKLPNGKVRGSLVVRVPPDALDGLVLDLRRELGKDGELKGLKIGSQDITKQYYDLESRLKAAKTMQERLLKIIQDGKGEIKQLLEAEKELGVWRTKIEEFEGEIRYYNSVVTLSTLNVILAEKEIRAAVDVVERETVDAGLEVEDVAKARDQALAAVAKAKGRVNLATVEQISEGQYNANLDFEVPPDAAGTLRDELRRIGGMVRLKIERSKHAEGGTATRDSKLRQVDTRFLVQLYNVTGLNPRETTTTTLAVADVPLGYRTLQETVVKAQGQIINGQVNEQDPNNVYGVLTFEVRRADAGLIQAALGAAGEAVARNVTRAVVEKQDATKFTDAKVRFSVTLKDVNQLTVRETTVLKLAAPDVPATYRSLQEVVAKVKGRVVKAQLNEQDRNNITAEFKFEIRRADEEAIRTALAAGGEVISRAVGRSDQKQDVTDSRVRYETTLYNANAIPPRETYKLLLEANDVEATAGVFAALLKESGGRILGSEVAHERDGQASALLRYEVPLSAAPTFVEQLKKHGITRAQQSVRNPQAPDGKLATARVNLTLAGSGLLVPEESDFWPKVRGGFGASVRFLLFSLSWIIFGVLVLLPWALVGYGAYRLGRRMFAPAAIPAPAAATTASTPPSA
jgi:hypothetical protein